MIAFIDTEVSLQSKQAKDFGAVLDDGAVLHTHSYADSDLDKHFILLNQTKLSISEIQQVWKAIKDMTAQRPTVSCSPLEIARKAGWGDEVEENPHRPLAHGIPQRG